MKRTGLQRSCSIFTITGMPKSQNVSAKKESKARKLLNFVRQKIRFQSGNTKSELEKEVEKLKLELADRDRIIQNLLKQHKETNAKLFTSNAPVKMRTIGPNRENFRKTPPINTGKVPKLDQRDPPPCQRSPNEVFQ